MKVSRLGTPGRATQGLSASLEPFSPRTALGRRPTVEADLHNQGLRPTGTQVLVNTLAGATGKSRPSAPASVPAVSPRAATRAPRRPAGVSSDGGGRKAERHRRPPAAEV